MPEFATIKRSDVPNAWKVGTRELAGPKARLHRGGCLYFSVQAAAAMGTEDCRVLAEFDEEANTLKFTRMEGRLPRGVTEGDLFPMRIRTGPNNRKPLGMISILALLKYIGYGKNNGPVDFPILAIDPKARSITVSLSANDRRQSPEAKPSGQEVPPGRLHADGGHEEANDGQHHQD